jgi:hypothetical protein
LGGVRKILSQLTQPPSTYAEIDCLPAQASQEVFTFGEIAKSLGGSARKKQPCAKFGKPLLEADSGKDSFKEQIDAILSKAAQTALDSSKVLQHIRG